MSLPAILTHFNVYADGVSLLGEVEEITLPKIALKTDEYIGGGMAAPVEIPMHLQKLEAEINCPGWLKDAIKQFSMAKIDGGLWRFAGAYTLPDTGEVMAVEVVMRGRFIEIDRGKAKVGGKSDSKLKAALSYYKETVDGAEKIEIDAVNMIFKIDGKDMLDKQRKAIGLA